MWVAPVIFTLPSHTDKTSLPCLQYSAADVAAAVAVELSAFVFLGLSVFFSRDEKVALSARILFHHQISKCSILCQKDCGNNDSNSYPMTELIHLPTDVPRPDIQKLLLYVLLLLRQAFNFPRCFTHTNCQTFKLTFLRREMIF